MDSARSSVATMPESRRIRVATYNIRNVRALDRKSWWWRRRDNLDQAMRFIDADLWGLQEVFKIQNRWLKNNTFDSGWEHRGRGRNRKNRGEMCPIWTRRSRLRITASATRWFGCKPTQPGSRIPGARFPRLATTAEIRLRGDPQAFVVVNTHLDERSETRRLVALQQLAGWLESDFADCPAIVLGDFNTTLSESAAGPVLTLGLRPVLGPADGPTVHNYGKNPNPQTIDHILVSKHWTIAHARVAREAGQASDHWPVVADLSL